MFLSRMVLLHTSPSVTCWISGEYHFVPVLACHWTFIVLYRFSLWIEKMAAGALRIILRISAIARRSIHKSTATDHKATSFYSDFSCCARGLIRAA